MSPSASTTVRSPRAVLYGRVSAVMGRGEDLTSPELQERVVRDYAERRAYEVVDWLCDVDMTGKEWSRRQVEHAVRMIEANEADVIVVPRWSRFTRNLRDYVIQVARIEAAGGRVESAQEDIDPATSAGLLQRDLFAILAQWESRKIGEAWKETHERRIRAGLPHNFAPRLGYQQVAGRYVPDPIQGPLVTSLYRRYLAGSGLQGLADWLLQQGVTSFRTDRAWSTFGLKGTLDSGFAAGLLIVKGEYAPGAQIPLISKTTWERYQALRTSRRIGPRPQVCAPPTALSGLVHCSTCGYLMRISDESMKAGRRRAYLYQCDSRVGCTNRAWITRSRLEAHMKAWFERQASGEQNDELATEFIRQSENVIDLQRQLLRLEAGRVKNRVDYVAGEYGAAMRNKVETALNTRLEDVRGRVRHLKRAPTVAATASAAHEIVDHWDQWSPTQKNEALRLVITRINVLRQPGRFQQSISVDTA
jgi:site-specific DNA recombinase